MNVKAEGWQLVSAVGGLFSCKCCGLHVRHPRTPNPPTDSPKWITAFIMIQYVLFMGLLAIVCEPQGTM